MPYGVSLLALRRDFRAEAGISLNPLQGVAAQATIDILLERQQRELWDAYNWRHLRIFRDVPLAVGQYAYNYPEDLPFEQVDTAWFADSVSGKWKQLVFGISLGMVPPSGPMRGTPVYWDNVEARFSPGDAPTITSNGGGPTANVTVSVGSTAVTVVTATDPDAGQTLTYSIIGGTHASLFTINASSGLLQFLVVPAVGTYNVIVQVSDGHGGTDSQNITVTVDNPPTITSNGGGSTASVTVFLGSTFVTTVTATDPDAGQTLTYSIIGSTPANLFTIGASSGTLAFLNAQATGTYNVIVQVSDGHGGTDSQNITVTVRTDIPRAGPYAVAPSNPIGQLALLPVPASAGMLLRLEGQAAINPLVSDTDSCLLDSKLIVLFAAAEYMAVQKNEAAAMKLTKAQNYLRRLLANETANKRRNVNMAGSYRYGVDPDRGRQTPYLDYIPS